MSNRLMLLADYDRWLHRTVLLRWIVRAVLLMLLLLAIFETKPGAPPFYYGFFFILLPAGIMVDAFRAFLRQEVAHEESIQVTQANGLTYASALVLAHSLGDARRLWFYVLHAQSTRFVLFRLGLNSETFSKVSALPDYKTWLETAQTLAQTQQSPLRVEHLFEAIQSQSSLQAIWRELGITDQTRQEVWAWQQRIEIEEKKQNRGFVDQIRMAGGIGRDWSSGYTQALEVYASDLTKDIQRVGEAISLIGHTEERAKVLEYLGRSEVHNTLLIGDEGIGKTRMIYALASDFNAGTVPINLKYKHIYMLDTGRLVSSGSQVDLEGHLHAVFGEAASVGNVILVIPDIHLLVGAQGNEKIGMINASPIISSYLKSPLLQIVGLTTESAYYTYIKPNAALDPFLLPVEVKEIGPKESLQILEDELPRFEASSKHAFTYQGLEKVIEIADRHVHDTPYPEKAIELLDEVAGVLAAEPQALVMPADVERILSAKLKIPMGSVSGQERDVLNNLEGTIRQRIIGQEEAVQGVANALRRARAGLNSGKRPIGSFLFLGPTGVGKTEMAKTIAAIYYKNDKAFVRVDMSEYQTPDSIGKLIGTNDKPGVLTTAVTDQPFSVVLLDEIEKADKDIRNLFLQILDDGHITNGNGQKVDFTNAMVIATSNAGSELIRQAVEQGALDANFKPKLLDSLQAQSIFPPEWLNRFDSVIVFLPLTKDEIRSVAHLQVQELVNQMKSNNINLTVEDDVYDVLVERGYDPQFGARPMRRAVQDIIEAALAKQLINDSTPGIKNITLTKAMLV